MKVKLIYYPEDHEDAQYVTIGNVYDVEYYRANTDYCEIYDDGGELHGIDIDWVEIVEDDEE